MITSNDWKIHKKLDETRTVYIYPARGQGGTIYQILEHLSNNKIVAVRYGDQYKYYHPKNFPHLLRWYQNFIE